MIKDYRFFRLIIQHGQSACRDAAIPRLDTYGPPVGVHIQGVMGNGACNRGRHRLKTPQQFEDNKSHNNYNDNHEDSPRSLNRARCLFLSDRRETAAGQVTGHAAINF